LKPTWTQFQVVFATVCDYIKHPMMASLNPKRIPASEIWVQGGTKARIERPVTTLYPS
jgi:hypothetical protein